MGVDTKSWFMKLLEQELPDGSTVTRTEICLARRTLIAEVILPSGRECKQGLLEAIRTAFAAREVGGITKGSTVALNIQGFALPLTADQ